MSRPDRYVLAAVPTSAAELHSRYTKLSQHRSQRFQIHNRACLERLNEKYKMKDLSKAMCKWDKKVKYEWMY